MFWISCVSHLGVGETMMTPVSPPLLLFIVFLPPPPSSLPPLTISSSDSVFPPSSPSILFLFPLLSFPVLSLVTMAAGCKLSLKQEVEGKMIVKDESLLIVWVEITVPAAGGGRGEIQATGSGI